MLATWLRPVPKAKKGRRLRTARVGSTLLHVVSMLCSMNMTSTPANSTMLTMTAAALALDGEEKILEKAYVDDAPDNP
jgi:hypothetical protein